MGFTEPLKARYRHFTLQRIQRRFDKLRARKGRPRSQLKSWLQAADQVERNIRRTLLLLISLLVLLPSLWIVRPLLPESMPSSATPSEPAPPPTNTPLPTPTTKTVPRYQVQYPLLQSKAETMQILDKIRQRALPITIEPVPEKENQLLFTDHSPATREDAERLLQLYNQLFGVEGKINESIVEQAIESAPDARL